jgi:hypothetical protein
MNLAHWAPAARTANLPTSFLKATSPQTFAEWASGPDCPIADPLCSGSVSGLDPSTAGMDPYVGAATGPGAEKLHATRQAAYHASAKASDSGQIAFQEHRGHPIAVRDNIAAVGAWRKVWSAGVRWYDDPNPDVSRLAHEAREDAEARIGELEVARQALVFDAWSHGTGISKGKKAVAPPRVQLGDVRPLLEAARQQQAKSTASAAQESAQGTALVLSDPSTLKKGAIVAAAAIAAVALVKAIA